MSITGRSRRLNSRVEAAARVLGAPVARVGRVGCGGRSVRGQREADEVRKRRSQTAATQQRALRGFELAADGVAIFRGDAVHARQFGERELERAFAGEQPFDLGVRHRFGGALQGKAQPYRGRHCG